MEAIAQKKLEKIIKDTEKDLADLKQRIEDGVDLTRCTRKLMQIGNQVVYAVLKDQCEEYKLDYIDEFTDLLEIENPYMQYSSVV